jgi:hypothetical protein
VTDGLTDIQRSIVNEVETFLIDSQAYPLTANETAKIYVCLAYEMFNVDLEERGFELLRRIDSAYFSNGFREELKTDSQFAYLVSQIIGKLEEIGLVKITVVNSAKLIDGVKDENNNG